jgi:benzoyl-CoA reductase/2-hydroxyglutaryl-CoA dehydratase subunit BcrC/BadD/HgdB
VIGLRQIYELAELAFVMNVEKHTKLLQEILDAISEKTRSGETALPPESIDDFGVEATRIFLTGKIVRPLELWDIIEEAGGTSVGDMICVGSGYFEKDVRQELSPLEGLVDHYLHTSFFDTFFNESRDRASDVVSRAKKSEAQGAILINTQFCEAQNFSTPGIKEALEQEGIPTLVVETDLQGVSRGQLETRVQALMEMIEAPA